MASLKGYRLEDPTRNCIRHLLDIRLFIMSDT
jgi:hypothetical protein